MKFEYRTKGVCSRSIILDIEDGIVKDVEFIGGCNGNLKGICSLVKGLSCEEVKKRLSGIRCGLKPTSCPDQLTKAIDEALAAGAK
ncbi:MAG: TIGR03905 family TSCPD domain-containing protein [Anaerovoracaceae bacterium]|nr:TIGR03905 family TSCPD domain-containing protein [Anaerovoracaceae bacterium]